MPKAPRETQPRHRFDPIARPSNNGHVLSERQNAPSNAHSPSIHRIRHILNQTGEDFPENRSEQSCSEGRADHENLSEDDDGEDNEEEYGDDEYANVFDKGYLLRVSLLTAGPPRVTRTIRVPIHLSFTNFMLFSKKFSIGTTLTPTALTSMSRATGSAMTIACRWTCPPL